MVNLLKVTRLIEMETGVGKTEDILGVEETILADYKGVELKCLSKLKSSLQTLFTMEPEWPKNAEIRKIILNNYGYSSDGEIKLNTTVTSSENNRGWSLEIENSMSIF